MLYQEALERQKTSQLKRNVKGGAKENAIRAYIEEELEVHLSIVEAEKSLEELMEYRYHSQRFCAYEVYAGIYIFATTYTTYGSSWKVFL